VPRFVSQSSLVVKLRILEHWASLIVLNHIPMNFRFVLEFR